LGFERRGEREGDRPKVPKAPVSIHIQGQASLREKTPTKERPPFKGLAKNDLIKNRQDRPCLVRRPAKLYMFSRPALALVWTAILPKRPEGMNRGFLLYEQTFGTILMDRTGPA
jgi:hypothetical protein